MADKSSIDIQELMDETGLSRATIYRRLKQGKTPEQIMGRPPRRAFGSPDEQDEQADATEIVEYQATLSWCRAVLWAAENMHVKKMTRKEAGSDLKYSMWHAAQDYPKELLVQLVPKALAYIERQSGAEEFEAEGAEKEGIEKLEELLREALREAEGVTV